MTPQELSRVVRRWLESDGRRGHQGPDGEAVTRLTKPVRPEPVDPQALLEQIRRRHESLGPIDLSEETIRELRDEGRR